MAAGAAHGQRSVDLLFARSTMIKGPPKSSPRFRLVAVVARPLMPVIESPDNPKLTPTQYWRRSESAQKCATGCCVHPPTRVYIRHPRLSVSAEVSIVIGSGPG